MADVTTTGNLPQEQIDETSSFFNNYFRDPISASQFTNDAVVGFFENYTKNKDTAKVLAAAIYGQQMHKE